MWRISSLLPSSVPWYVAPLYSYFLVCYSYVTRKYSYVVVHTCMLLICYWYVIRRYSYTSRMYSPVSTRMYSYIRLCYSMYSRVNLVTALTTTRRIKSRIQIHPSPCVYVTFSLRYVNLFVCTLLCEKRRTMRMC